MMIIIVLCWDKNIALQLITTVTWTFSQHCTDSFVDERLLLGNPKVNAPAILTEAFATISFIGVIY
jgi:hypothetical protein